ncbi:MAG: hypothetical protein HWN67_14415 [Candidatus Helarchaeota archaeon]|nr:hypothetical protein [Candidatus Helarchaeota archaeon]
MDEYDQFDLEYAKHLIIRGLLGAVIATILSAIAYLLVLPENAFRIFKGVTQFQQDFLVINPVITTGMVVLTMSLVSPTTIFLPVFNPADAFPLAIAAVVIWIIVGTTMGLISKNCWKGAEAAFWSTLMTFVLAVILALVAVFSIGLLIGGTIAAFGWFLIIVGSAYLAALTFGISLVFGFIGGYIGSKIFEEY